MVTVQIGQLLSQPGPEALDRHQIGAVRRQKAQLDSQLCSLGADQFGVVVTDVVPDHDDAPCGVLISKFSKRLIGGLCRRPRCGM